MQSPRSPRFPAQALATSLLVLAAQPASATGLATCESGPKSGWQATEVLEKRRDRG